MGRKKIQISRITDERNRQVSVRANEMKKKEEKNSEKFLY